MPVEVVVVVEALSAEEHGSLHRPGVTVERLEQGGLAGAGRTHQRHQLIGKDGERDRVQQPLAAGHLNHNVLGFDGDLAVVVSLRQFAALQQLEANAAQADLLAGLGQHLAGDAYTVDVGAVAGAEVLDQNAVRGLGQPGVAPGDGGKIQGNIAVGVASGLHRLLTEGDSLEGGLADLHLGFQREKLLGGDLVRTQVDLVGGVQNGAMNAVAQLPDRGSVARVEVFEKVRAVLISDDGVVPTDDGQVDLHVGIWRASDGDLAGAAGRRQRTGEFAGVGTSRGDGPGQPAMARRNGGVGHDQVAAVAAPDHP